MFGIALIRVTDPTRWRENMCTLCFVDDAMKKKIAAYGASFP